MNVILLTKLCNHPSAESFVFCNGQLLRGKIIHKHFKKEGRRASQFLITSVAGKVKKKVHCVFYPPASVFVLAGCFVVLKSLRFVSTSQCICIGKLCCCIKVIVFVLASYFVVFKSLYLQLSLRTYVNEIYPHTAACI